MTLPDRWRCRMATRRRLRAIAGKDGWNGWNMAGAKGTHTGLLVVRVWREQMTEGRLGISARITSTVDVSLPDDRTVMVASADEVGRAVREWLRDYLVAYPRHL